MLKAVLIDDDPIAVRIIKNALEKYEVFGDIFTFIKPLEALDAIKEINPDVIFTDVEMPELNGLELARLILEYDSNIKLIFITAYNSYAIEAFELYAVDYLLKPITMERLNQTIKRIMQVCKSSCPKESEEKLKILSFDKLDICKGNKHIRWNGSKTEELFAFLLHNVGEKVMKDTIVDLLWGDYGYRRALRNMQTTMYRVRRSLDELGNYVSIEYSCNSYTLKLIKNVYYDYMEFEKIFNSIYEVNNDNLNEVLRAFEIYQGDYLDVNGYVWSLANKVATKKKYYELYVKMMGYCDITDDIQHVIMLLKKSIQKNPNSKAMKALLKKYQNKLGDDTRLNNIIKPLCQYDLMLNVLELKAGFAILKEHLCKIVNEGGNMIICVSNITGLKEVNNILGHEIGDDLVIKVIRCIKKCIRQYDFIIRIRGDKFLVAFIDIDIEHAEKVWERIESEFKNINSNKEIEYSINVSYGLVECNPMIDNLKDDEYLNQKIKLAYKRMQDRKNYEN